ncbi:NADH:ubiquinone reductase (Na(+)-transporting) subunit C [Prevotella sp. oral taxon 475]|uniref:NADH:ubiquinone reductase (Na(+)-transporting) subunit C n=1 Tax=Prevotella sp. oral taxon 475 TaxID=712471 RepID=UPI001BA91D59|nr:NADH:ubiquinone reductase (Na(+)-transporting) subunit C [Prevotella sp. oral taxon 475]QUB48197.1 NADH:ubiquinone reductase (Na(+)-transporting) subunit C [Prevotella sp. oral taxon 475]
MAEEKKKRFDTNANGYTLIYSVVIVVVVAFLLAFVFKALKPMQDVNVALDKKKQLLYALDVRDITDEEAAAKYKELVLADEIIDVNGNVLKKGEQGGEKAGFLLNSADYKAGRLALYICRVDGQTKYILPVYGMGLWGPISGYIALNDDKNTVYGAYFNHEGETAGLGAEIKDNQAWQEQFRGKKIFAKDGQHNKVALSVVKQIEDPTTQVDVVTGATLTSNGVTDMLAEGLSKYLVFLTSK